jgi:hypothetical protein
MATQLAPRFQQGLSNLDPGLSSSAMAPILRRAPLGGESNRSVFEIVTLLCRRETMNRVLAKDSIYDECASRVPFWQMCLTMDGMSIFIVKHICRRDTKALVTLTRRDAGFRHIVIRRLICTAFVIGALLAEKTLPCVFRHSDSSCEIASPIWHSLPPAPSVQHPKR